MENKIKEEEEFNKYKNTVIYKIVCKDENIKDVYVGSTIDFNRRQRHHKSYCKNEKSKAYNYKVYKFIRDNGDWNNFNMIEIEKYSCKNKFEKLKRERYWYEELNAKLNSDYPNRCKKDYLTDNKDKILEKNREYRINNKDKILENKKEYYENNKNKILEKQLCICGKEYTSINKIRHNKSKFHQKYIQNNSNP
jgi:hypothetical protein